MATALPSWVEEAATLPVRFAQVREDPLLDLSVVDSLPAPVRVAAVASGGCTAAVLAASPRVRRLVLVDPNPAQIALTRFKLRVLQAVHPRERPALLGRRRLSERARGDLLSHHLDAIGLPPDALGPPATVARDGPDHAGRYERVFLALRRALGSSGTAGVEWLLGGPRAWFGEPRLPPLPRESLLPAIDAAFEEAMPLPVLTRLFGEEATRGPARPFAAHFAERTRAALQRPDAANNPFLTQVLLGRDPPEARARWLDIELRQRDAFPGVEFVPGTMDAALEAAAAGAFDCVHLSNVLDWLAPEDAAATLARARRALRPGGRVLIRQLNSTLDIPSLGAGFRWLRPEAAALHARDRSYFYAALHLGEAA